MKHFIKFCKKVFEKQKLGWYKKTFIIEYPLEYS